MELELLESILVEPTLTLNRTSNLLDCALMFIEQRLDYPPDGILGDVIALFFSFVTGIVVFLFKIGDYTLDGAKMLFNVRHRPRNVVAIIDFKV